MIARDIGFVLRRYNFRETSLIANIYTLNHGNIKGVFKAFYTPKRTFSTSLDLFTLNEFVFYPKKRELWLVSFADQVADFPYLRKSYSKNSTACLMTTMVDKILPIWDANSDVFYLLMDCLRYLEHEDESKVLYMFLIKLLGISGFEPQFDHCLRCHGELKGKIFFSASRGGMLCHQCTTKVLDVKPVGNDVSLSIRYIQSVEFPKTLQLKIAKPCEQRIFYLLREFIMYHLEIDIFTRIKGEFSFS